MAPFLIGINMAGAVSAGAYTAGVLDFLIEALDAWYAAKAAGQAVPTHDVSIEVFSGASAGGMCAAIASVMVQGEFDHIHDASPDAPESTNRFYESWVNKIDIRELLGTNDLRNGGPVISLLDCTVIDEIAKYALQPGKPKARKYISPRLTLFLTLTNATGIPYRLDPGAPGPVEEGTLFHTDRLRFQTVPPGGTAPPKIAKPLPVGQPNQGAWALLRETAKATGAFPIFLAPRILWRDKSDYDIPMWQSVNPAARRTETIAPAWPAGMPDSFPTLNMDGGVIDNDPFNLAHDYLTSINPGAIESGTRNPREPGVANAAIITVSPFPSSFQFNPRPVIDDGVVTKATGSLASVLIAQSRFFGESLAVIAGKRAFSRFLIAPSDNSVAPGTPALQCASLGAFGGFFEREFRAHDFMLGRRNCQQFLRRQFVLPAANPLIRDGVAALGERRKDFQATAPQSGAAPGEEWYPLIPLCTDELRQKLPAPARRKLGAAKLQDIVDLIYERGRVVVPALAKQIPTLPVRAGLDAAEQLIGLFGLGKDQLTDYLRQQLGDSVAED